MGNQIAGSFHNPWFEIVYVNFYSSKTLSEDYFFKKKKKDKLQDNRNYLYSCMIFEGKRNTLNGFLYSFRGSSLILHKDYEGKNKPTNNWMYQKLKCS